MNYPFPTFVTNNSVTLTRPIESIVQQHFPRVAREDAGLVVFDQPEISLSLGSGSRLANVLVFEPVAPLEVTETGRLKPSWPRHSD